MSGFDKAVETLKKLQRSYTTIRLDTELSSQSLDAVKALRDLVEELVVEAYGPKPSPFKPGVEYDGGIKPDQVYVVSPTAIPPGFILVDEQTLCDLLLAPAAGGYGQGVVKARIRELFNKTS